MPSVPFPSVWYPSVWFPSMIHGRKIYRRELYRRESYRRKSYRRKSYLFLVNLNQNGSTNTEEEARISLADMWPSLTIFAVWANQSAYYKGRLIWENKHGEWWSKFHQKMLIKRELLHYLTVKYDEKASDNVTDEGMFGRPPMDEICRTVGRGGRRFTYTAM